MPYKSYAVFKDRHHAIVEIDITRSRDDLKIKVMSSIKDRGLKTPVERAVLAACSALREVLFEESWDDYGYRNLGLVQDMRTEDSKPVNFQGKSTTSLIGLANVHALLDIPVTISGTGEVLSNKPHEDLGPVLFIGDKLKAASKVLGAGGVFFYPASQKKEVELCPATRVLRDRGVRLLPVINMYEAVKKLVAMAPPVLRKKARTQWFEHRPGSGMKPVPGEISRPRRRDAVMAVTFLLLIAVLIMLLIWPALVKEPGVSVTEPVNVRQIQPPVLEEMAPLPERVPEAVQPWEEAETPPEPPGRTPSARVETVRRYGPPPLLP